MTGVTYHWDFSFLWMYRWLLLKGLGFTILYTVGSIVFGLLIGLLVGLMCTAALPAFAGQSGLRAALLARGGFTATQSVIEARYGLGQCFAQTPHLAYLTDGLGKHW